MKDATFGTGNADPSGAFEFTPIFKSGSCCSIFSFLFYVLQIVVCPFGHCVSIDLRLLITPLVS